MRTLLPMNFVFFCLNWSAPPDAAQLPTFYREVAEVHWVVKDLDAAVRNWSKFGFPPEGQISERTYYSFDVKGRTATIRDRFVRGHIGGVSVV